MGVPTASLAMAGGMSRNGGLTMQRRVVDVPHMISLALQSFHKLYPLVELSQPGFVGGDTCVRLVYAAAAFRKPLVSREEQVEPLPAGSLVAPWDTSAITEELAHTLV